MLKATRPALVKFAQPVSIHGQASWDIGFVRLDDPDQELNTTRIGDEAIVGAPLKPGDRISVDYLVGVVVKITRLAEDGVGP